jgi:GNAT superfamily N-acetyltransferase
MLKVEKIDTRSKRDSRDFLTLPFELYRGHPLWVPPIRIDVATMLNRDKHPFYGHSDADFFVARKDGKPVGRITAMENKPYNAYHGTREAQFYHFECIEDFEVAQALFEAAFDWARSRGLTDIVGPKGFGALDGYGMLIEGFEFRPAMTMMNYNPPYYPEFAEKMGFEKKVDFVSCYLDANKFRMPDRIHKIAARAQRRSGLTVRQFKSKRELVKWADRIGRAYNESFINNWEYYPLTEDEIKFLTDNLMTVADPKLIKIITHEDRVVGFLFAFADVSAAIQRNGGRLFPFGLIDLLIEFRRTKWVSLNGIGILPEFKGRGGNALMYSEMEKTVRDYGFRHADLTQVAESAVEMRRDLESVGGVPYKNHRVFKRHIPD